MKVKIKPLKKYEVDINGKRIEMTLNSEWNGMAELRHKDQVLIIDNTQHVADKLFGHGLEGEFEVVKISPSLSETKE